MSIYTWSTKDFDVFEPFMLTEAAFIWSKYSKNSNIVKKLLQFKKNFLIV